jgi:hypothetical protein
MVRRKLRGRQRRFPSGRLSFPEIDELFKDHVREGEEPHWAVEIDSVAIDIHVCSPHVCGALSKDTSYVSQLSLDSESDPPTLLKLAQSVNIVEEVLLPSLIW